MGSLTNIERLDALVAAFYNNDAPANRKTQLINSVVITDEQAQAQFQKNTAQLNANQVAWFVVDRYREQVKALTTQKLMQSDQQAMMQAMDAARAAREAALAAL